jgi:hypothetical protein
MSKAERLFVYAVLLALSLVVVRSSWGGGGNEARAAGAARQEPAPAKIATCDVYAVMQVLVESDRYKPARVSEQDKARGQLKDIADQIKSLEGQLKSMDPKDEKTLQVFRDYNAKKEQFQERQSELDEFLGNQFVTAYEEVRKAADAVGEKLGYTHVIASRKANEKPSTDMDRITQQVLSRPMLRSPASDDITEAVLSELKL